MPSQIKKYLYIFAATLVFSHNYALAIDDAIVAVVNDDVITANDLTDYVSSYSAQLNLEGMSSSQLKEAMNNMQTKGLDRLIEDKIILHEADKMGLQVKNEAVDQRVEEIKAKYASDQIFNEALITNGATMGELRDKITEQLKISYVVDIEIRNKIVVNPQEVTDFYDKNKSMFSKKERIRLDSIFIGFNKNPDEAKQKAKEIMKQLAEGETFRKTAEQYSETPSIGIIERGQMKESIEKIVFNLKMNAISEPVEVEQGIFIFKLLEKLPPEDIPLEEVKEDITDRIFQSKFKAKYKKWVRKLKKSAYIEIKK